MLIIPSYYIVATLLLADLILSNFKGFFRKGYLVKNHKIILRRYWRFKGWVDIIFIISIILPVATRIYEFNYLKLILLLKL